MGTPNFSSNQLIIWSALLLGLLVAAVLGSAVGSSDLRLIAVVLGMIPVLVIFAHLKTNIWILIPIGWFFVGRLPWLPLPFTVRDMFFLIPIVFFLGFFAMRIVPWKRKTTTLDVLILINLAYLLTVYARNPVGFFAIQTSMVGGRPYFEIILAFCGYIILSRIKLTDVIARFFPLFFVVPTLLLGALEIVTRLIPQFGTVLNQVYTGVGGARESIMPSGPEAQIGVTRFTSLQFTGMTGVLALCARYNPITLISPFHPLRTLLFAAALLAIFLSGFRSAFLFAMVAFLLSALLRRRLRDVWVAGAAGALGLVLLISLQGSVIQLPSTMQRALSWLPGDWSEDAVADAEGSSLWRFEMWEWAWHDTRIMRDKVWGQGFGFTIDEMNIIANAMLAGQIGGEFLGASDRESFMITGAFHSGPLSTIKFIGIVGFIPYYIMMCYMAVLAWRLCRRAHGTKVFTLALFVCIPIIYEPFNFIFVFGGLDGNYSQLLTWAGLLLMTSNYLDAIVSKERRHPSGMPSDKNDLRLPTGGPVSAW